jgi:hypothetical protein
LRDLEVETGGSRLRWSSPIRPTFHPRRRRSSPRTQSRIDGGHDGLDGIRSSLPVAARLRAPRWRDRAAGARTGQVDILAKSPPAREPRRPSLLGMVAACPDRAVAFLTCRSPSFRPFSAASGELAIFAARALYMPFFARARRTASPFETFARCSP